MGEEIKVLKLKLARKQKRAETAIITVRCSKGLHQEIQLVAKPSMNQWCIAAFEKMLEENNEGSGQDQS
jgi:hypothetical protein